MNEFDLIDIVLAELGDVGSNLNTKLGPGDDAAVVAVPADHELVSSVDTLVADVHFPGNAHAALIGYRALAVSISDLAAMGARPDHVLLALTLPETNHTQQWVRDFAKGVRRGAMAYGVAVTGGNFAKGPLSITVSVHGFVSTGAAITRSGARVGDGVYVSAPLGGAAAALRDSSLATVAASQSLAGNLAAYYQPTITVSLGQQLQGHASAAIDVSDGLLQDVSHICRLSGVGVALDSAAIPIAENATLQDALTGGDDYALCFTAPSLPAGLDQQVTMIGNVVSPSGVSLDGNAVDNLQGYQHFS